MTTMGNILGGLMSNKKPVFCREINLYRENPHGDFSKENPHKLSSNMERKALKLQVCLLAQLVTEPYVAKEGST